MRRAYPVSSGFQATNQVALKYLTKIEAGVRVPLTRADVIAVRYTIYQSEYGVPVAGYTNKVLPVSSVLTDSPTEHPRWRYSSSPPNYRHNIPAAAFTDGPGRYRYTAVLTLTDGTTRTIQHIFQLAKLYSPLSSLSPPSPPSAPPPAVNSAPVLDSSVPNILGNVVSDAGAPFGDVGTVVSEIIRPGTNVSDANSGDELGMALLGANENNGTWYYRLPGGAWQVVGAVENGQSLLLGPSARVYFSAVSVVGVISNALTFRAWDGTAGTEGTKANVTETGGTTSFSTATATASIEVIAAGTTNSAPVLLVTGSSALPSVNEDIPPPSGVTGTPISLLVALGVNVTDADGDEPGIALTAISSTSGEWYYSVNGGTSWSLVGAVSTTSALLLRPADRLYFKPATDFSGTVNPAITFRAWDQSSGAFGAKVDTSSNGGASAFSVNTDTASITVIAINDAPVLNASIGITLSPSLEENSPAPVGTVGWDCAQLATLISAGSGPRNVSDADGDIPGVAVVAVNADNGTWHYSVTGGASWQLLGAVSASSALLLRPADRLYFQPNASYYGMAAEAVTFRAWDQSSGTHGTKSSTATSGGTTPFSTQLATASLTIDQLPGVFVPIHQYLMVGSGGFVEQGLMLAAQSTTALMGGAARTPAQDAASDRPWSRKISILTLDPTSDQLTDYRSGNPTAKSVYAADLQRYRDAVPISVVCSQGSSVYVGTDAGMVSWCVSSGVWPHQMTEEMGYDSGWLSVESQPAGNAPGLRLDFSNSTALNFHADQIIAQFAYRQGLNATHNGQWNDNLSTLQVNAAAMTWQQMADWAGRVKAGINALGGYWGCNLSHNFTNASMTDAEHNILGDNFDFIMLEGPARKRFLTSSLEITAAQFMEIITNMRYVMNRGCAIINLPLGTDAASSVGHNNTRERKIILAQNHPSGTGYQIGFNAPHYMEGTSGGTRIRKEVAVYDLHASLNGIKFEHNDVVIENSTTLQLVSAARVGTVVPSSEAKCRMLSSNFEYMIGLSLLTRMKNPPKFHVHVTHFSLNQAFNSAEAMNLPLEAGEPLNDTVEVVDSSGTPLDGSAKLVDYPGSYARRQFSNGELRVSTEDMRAYLA